MAYRLMTQKVKLRKNSITMNCGGFKGVLKPRELVESEILSPAAEYYPCDPEFQSCQKYLRQLLASGLAMMPDIISRTRPRAICSGCYRSLDMSIVSHPLWPYHAFCRDCLRHPRCISCERRAPPCKTYLDIESKLCAAQRCRVGNYLARMPLYICALCSASGIVTADDSTMGLLRRLLKEMSSDALLDMNFNRFGDTIGGSVQFRLGQNLQLSDYIDANSPSCIFVTFVDLHFLSRPQFLGFRVLPDQNWGEELVFGRCECLKNPKYSCSRTQEKHFHGVLLSNTSELKKLESRYLEPEDDKQRCNGSGVSNAANLVFRTTASTGSITLGQSLKPVQEVLPRDRKEWVSTAQRAQLAAVLSREKELQPVASGSSPAHCKRETQLLLQRQNQAIPGKHLVTKRVTVDNKHKGPGKNGTQNEQQAEKMQFFQKQCNMKSLRRDAVQRKSFVLGGHRKESLFQPSHAVSMRIPSGGYSGRRAGSRQILPNYLLQIHMRESRQPRHPLLEISHLHKAHMLPLPIIKSTRLWEAKPVDGVRKELSVAPQGVEELKRQRRGRQLLSISIADKLPFDVFTGTFAHEITHSYIFLSGYRLTHLQEESLCNAVCLYYVFNSSLKYLKMIHGITSLLDRTNHMDRFLMGPSSKRLASSVLGSQMAEDIRQSHGEGTLLRLTREKIILRRNLCVYRLKRMLCGDTIEYLGAVCVLPLLLKHGLHRCMNLFHSIRSQQAQKTIN